MNNPKRERQESAMWLPAGEDIVSGAEYCPHAIAAYKENEILGLNHKHQRILASTVRKHLVFIGWKIECFRSWNVHRIRYTSPSGDVYYSLIDICRLLSTTPQVIDDINSRPDHEIISSPSTDETSQQSCVSTEESDLYFPEAVVKYFLMGQDEEAHNEKARSLALKAKKHLSAIGWRFDQRPKNGGKLEKIYISPAGKIFYSLRTACGWCVKIEGLSCNKLYDHQETQDLEPNEVKVAENSGNQRKRMRSSSRQHSSAATEQTSVTALGRTRATILSNLIDADVVLPGVKVQYRSRRDGPALKEGRIRREGIECICCQKVFTLSKFEAHAGSKRHRPSESLYLEDGRSLRECRLPLTPKNYARNTPGRESDYICSVCQDGRELLLCDKCPSAFHASCLGLKEVPDDGTWFCPSCCCSICGNGELEDNLVKCGQCECQYHVRCLLNKGILGPDQIGNCHQGNWFCNKGCEKIYFGLQELLGKPMPLGFDNLTWTLLKHRNPGDSTHGQPQDCYRKLNHALKVLHGSFLPVKEGSRDILEDVIFNRRSDLNRLNFQGFYTVVLERDRQLITVATLRVFGQKVAELPFVTTQFRHRGQGMCRILMTALEKKLTELRIENLVLPAAHDVLDTWTKSLGFSVMEESERLNFLDYIFLYFQGAIMCRKRLKMG